MGNESAPGVPRWVKITALVAAVAVVIVVVLLLVGGGERHGPGRHGGSPAGIRVG